ncbi:glycosyl transferase [Pseudomonas sp. GW531-E2]|uniref:MraY family glycosyltransferase n=1 Tax=unclassified Pseudomonas TaxID=196821 RepID=UPI000C886EBA|nr:MULTISPECIES: glycosyltransferase family 4 protein [unclassified Pseudomonas]PNA24661.1 glycosyl transferase [Pseudomonas sp. MPR-R1B]PNB57281.1 glycosyl transferase [Pseudomonas sp. GW531-E2]
MSYWILPIAALLVSYLLTGTLRRYAIARSIIDVPNARSSHSVPTPRGGGVAIVLAFLAALPVAYGLDLISTGLLIGSLGGCGLVAVIGFLDDHGHIAARWRLLGHFSAACWVLFWLGNAPKLVILGATLDISLVTYVLAAFYIVWMLNLYNFMDGIDGLASLQAITVCLGACVIYVACGASSMVWAPALLALAVAGFLFWNFPPARILMGDAGSGFLGIQLALLSLHAANGDPVLLWSWIILMGVFIVDATFTLARRLLRGDKVYEAHRSHAYQYASRYFGKHRPVTLAVTAINLLWLLPWAAIVALGHVDALVGVIVAYAPLLALAVKFKAGQREMVDKSPA